MKIFWICFIYIFSFTISNFALAQGLDSDILSLEDIENTTKVSNIDPKENLDDQSKKISLRDAIEEGLRRNSFQISRRYQKEKIELTWKDDYSDFWYPQLSLKLNTDENLVDNLYTDVNSTNGTSKTANGYVGLVFDDYTVFNWGKDYLKYLNNKESYKRNKQALNEKRRQLRFNIISQYFNLAKSKRILSIKKSQLRHTSFIYRLAREQLTLKKIRGQQYLQTKAEYLRSHTEYQAALYDVTEQEQALAYYLGDELTTSYTPIEQLKFVPLTTLRHESYKYASTRSPNILQAKTNLANANRTFRKTLKENMPLPKFAVKLGAYKHNLSDSGAYDSTGLEGGSRNVELVASINMSWKIFGSGGLFNSRVTERSYLDKKIAEIEFRESKRDINTNVNTLHRQIRYMEKQVEANQAFLKNSRKTFDRTLDNYIASKTSFANIKLVLDSLILSEVQFENAKYQHLVNKLKLADLMGMDDFPGESFEKMVLK